jgi:predicted GNAT family N-acyltransferase
MSPVQVHIASLAQRPLCHHLRRIVFIDEQGVPEADELDDRDGESLHLLAWRGEEAVGTARMRLVGELAKAERVAVRADARGQGVGAALMARIETEAMAQGLQGVKLAAQESAVTFYLRLGYEIFGEPFTDAGIPHRWMKKALSPEGPESRG